MNDWFKDCKPELSPGLFTALTMVRTAMGLTAKTVYYPCCHVDVTPSSVFPDARVIYVDTLEPIVQMLRANHFEAHHSDAQVFDPGMLVDVLVMLNPQTTPDAPANHVRHGGYMVCNNYHGTATHMRKRTDYQLVGTVLSLGDEALQWDVGCPEEYWAPVSTDEDLFERDPGNFITRFVDKYLPGDAPIMERYHALAARVPIEMQKWNDMLRLMGQDYGDDLGSLNLVDSSDMSSQLPALPYKKNAYLYVFQRTTP